MWGRHLLDSFQLWLQRHATCCWRLIQQLADSTGSDWSVESDLSEADLAWDDLWRSESQVCGRVYGPSSWLTVPSIDLLLISIASFIRRPSSRPAFRIKSFYCFFFTITKIKHTAADLYTSRPTFKWRISSMSDEERWSCSGNCQAANISQLTFLNKRKQESSISGEKLNIFVEIVV